MSTRAIVLYSIIDKVQNHFAQHIAVPHDLILRECKMELDFLIRNHGFHKACDTFRNGFEAYGYGQVLCFRSFNLCEEEDAVDEFQKALGFLHDKGTKTRRCV